MLEVVSPVFWDLRANSTASRLVTDGIGAGRGGPALGDSWVLLQLEYAWFVRGAWCVLNEAVSAQRAFGRRC